VYLADLLRAHRQRIGSRWRRLDTGRQALLVLAHLRNGDTYPRLAAGFGIGIATVYRYVREAVHLLAAQAPDLRQVIERAVGLWYLILDGTLIRIDRVAEDRPYYSGKHKRHGVNVQVLADSRGRLLWASAALPGSTHDLTAARAHGVIDALADADLWAYADLAYQGAGPNITVPFRRRPRRLSRNQRAVNRNRSRNRAPGERAVATLKTWKILGKLRCCRNEPPPSSPPSAPFRPSKTSVDEVGKGAVTDSRHEPTLHVCHTIELVNRRQVRLVAALGGPTLVGLVVIIALISQWYGLLAFIPAILILAAGQLLAPRSLPVAIMTGFTAFCVWALTNLAIDRTLLDAWGQPVDATVTSLTRNSRYADYDLADPAGRPLPQLRGGKDDFHVGDHTTVVVDPGRRIAPKTLDDVESAFWYWLVIGGSSVLTVVLSARYARRYGRYE
jgi:hypothetical protein